MDFHKGEVVDARTLIHTKDYTYRTGVIAYKGEVIKRKIFGPDQVFKKTFVGKNEIKGLLIRSLISDIIPLPRLENRKIKILSK